MLGGDFDDCDCWTLEEESYGGCAAAQVTIHHHHLKHLVMMNTPFLLSLNHGGEGGISCTLSHFLTLSPPLSVNPYLDPHPVPKKQP